MAYLGVVSGVGDGNFNPDAPLTREMAAVILSQLADAMDIPLATAEPSFADNSEISSWAVNQTGIIQKAGIMSGVGDNRFAPHDYYTREQSITTVIRMKDVFVPVDKIGPLNDITITNGDRIAVPELTILPQNATNKNFEWKSSDTNIADVYEAEGVIAGINNGTAQITVTAASGASSSFTVTVTPSFANLKPPIGTELNVLAHKSNYAIQNYDDIPDNPKISSTVAVTNVTETHWGVNFTVKLTSILEGYDDNLKDYFNPYIKWKLTDEAGKTVQSGVKRLNLSAVGDTEDISLYFDDIKQGVKYFLEFANDEAEAFNYIESEPVIKIKGLPLTKTQKSDSFFNPQEATYTLECCDYEMEYDTHDVVYSPIFTAYGHVEAEDYDSNVHMVFSWKIKDSHGETVGHGMERIPFYDLDKNGNFEISFEDGFIELEPGETYYLTFSK